MPIKFRCPHCQQFLGISRSRAGAVTDCPTCGRTIRVPLLDGSTPPLPAPELNLADRGLATALDKLAGLADGDDVVHEPIAAREVAVRESHQPPPPAPAPQPIALPPAPQPVVIAAEAGGARMSSASAAVVDRALAERAEELLLTIAPAPAGSAGAAATGDRSAPPAGRVPKGVFLIGLTIAGLAAAFGAGFWLGRSSGGTVAASAAGSPRPEPPAPEAAPAAAVVASQPALTGRVSYVAAGGETRPDAGARILVLPEERQGTAKLSAEGFRSGAAAADFRLAQAAAAALGGAFAIADAEGQYAIALPQAGLYQVVILSRYQPRDAAPLPAAVLQFLGTYFERPPQLIGDAAVHLSQFRYRGSGPSPRDQTFERP